MQNTSLALDKVMNTLWIIFLCHRIHELQSFKNGLVSLAEIDLYFLHSIVYLNLRQKYLETATINS